MEESQAVSESEHRLKLWERKRQIFYQALPFQTGRADFARMPFSEETHPAGLLHDLLEKGSFEGLLPPASYENPPFEHWYQELRNTKRLQGHHSLALGFPLLLFSKENTVRAVPLFLFELELEPSVQQTGTWRLWHGEAQQVHINPWLEAHLANRGKTALKDKLDGLRRKKPIKTDFLKEQLDALAAQLDLSGPSQRPVLEPSPSIGELDDVAESGKICWSAVVGSFPLMLPAFSSEKEELLPNIPPHLPEGHAATGGMMDPYQMTAFQAGRRHGLTVLDGRSGTGKSFVIQQLLLNALSNGRKCLLIAPTLETLRSTRRWINQLQLGAYTFSATDVYRDSSLLMELLRTSGEAAPPSRAFNGERYQQVLHKWQREKSKLDEAYRALHQPVFGNHSWAETTGLYLESSRLEGKELLTAQLNIQDFRFRYDEYEQLIAAVEQCRPLYNKVNTLRHPLQNIHPQVFVEKSRGESYAFVTEQLDIYTKKLFLLQKRYIEKVNEYADLLSDYYEAYYDRLEKQLQSLEEEIRDALDEYGRDFELNSMTSLRLYGALLRPFKERLKAKESIFENYRVLVASFEEQPLFDFTFATAEEGRDLPRMRKSLEAFGQALASWRDKLPDLIQENLSRMSSKTVHPELSFKGHVIELEEALDLQLAELNRTQLYANPLENRMLTIPRRRKYMEEVIEQLENTRLFMRDFDAFYEWQRFWLTLSDRGRKLIQALIKVRPDNWEAAFKSWYLYHCLQQYYQPGLPTSGLGLRQFVFNNDQVQSILPAQTAHLWWRRRQELFREMRRNDRKRYQQLFTRKHPAPSDTDLNALFRAHGDIITELMPLWLVTPSVAQALTGNESCFEMVLVEESHLIPGGAIPEELLEVEHLVVTGNREWEALGPSASVFALAKRQVEQVHHLPYVHRWSPGDALALRDPAYLTHDAITGFSAHFRQIDGRYDDQYRTNDAEAREIIRLLNEVEKTPQRTYPSIAIATMTTAQRDLIAAYLRDIKQRELPGVEVIHQLERNGLGVYQIEELTGQHPDVLFLSCTYGPADLDNDVTDHLAELNRPEGLSKLSLLMTRPRKAIFVVNSVPEQVIQRNLKNSAHAGTFLLSNYLKYIYALHIADAEQQQWIIQNLIDHYPQAGISRPNSPFIRELATSLQSFIAKERIHEQVMDAHFYLPLKVDPAAVEAKPAAVFPDGFFASTPQTDYRWEFEQRELYRRHGYALVPAWSVNWWKNAAVEARNLAELIKQKSEEKRPEHS